MLKSLASPATQHNPHNLANTTLGNLPGRADRMAKVRMAPFTAILKSHEAALDIAARRQKAAAWFRSSTPAWSLKVYLTLRRTEWQNRRSPDHEPGTVKTRADSLAAAIGISQKTLQRAVRLLVDAGLLESKRRGACVNYQASCVGSTYTFPDQVVPNHQSSSKELKREEGLLLSRVFSQMPYWKDGIQRWQAEQYRKWFRTKADDGKWITLIVPSEWLEWARRRGDDVRIAAGLARLRPGALIRFVEGADNAETFAACGAS